MKKFALFPRVVGTWRNTRALIWLQSYYIKQPSEFVALSEDSSKVGDTYCLKLGKLSIEF